MASDQRRLKLRVRPPCLLWPTLLPTAVFIERPRISLAFDEEDFFDKSKTIVCGTHHLISSCHASSLRTATDTTVGISAPPKKKKAKAVVACKAANRNPSKALTSGAPLLQPVQDHVKEYLTRPRDHRRRRSARELPTADG